MKIYKNLWKITTGQGDDYKTGCLLGYNYFKKHYKMIVIDLSNQQALDADPKAIQQINFAGNIIITDFSLFSLSFVIEEAIKTIF